VYKGLSAYRGTLSYVVENFFAHITKLVGKDSKKVAASPSKTKRLPLKSISFAFTSQKAEM